MAKYIIFLFLMIISYNSSSQSLDHRLGEIIVQIENNTHPRIILESKSHQKGADQTDFDFTPLITEMNIWTIKFDQNKINELNLLDQLQSNKNIINAQLNYLIEYRKTPNDPLFDEQWQYLNVGQLGAPSGIDLKMDEVWNITTGGITSEGDTIVLCVIDDGIDPTHLDILPNLWKNYAETASNGIDDDGNGYVDDYNGWNVDSEDDNIFKNGRHGTAVTGIVGAKGNNMLGVTGMNWDVKLMVISGISDIASVIEAYSYPLKLRTTYNETGGKKGAFVVGTNASWGVKNSFPIDAPIWCSLYDMMGEAGILSCGAAPNADMDVDIVGDLPSTCTSDYFIGVTNINRLDKLQNRSGYGSKSIDLGAFGEDTYTTAKGNDYRKFGGTSGATPHVTGAIGLLYSADNCNNLASLSKTDPGLAALTAKSYLLNNTMALADLSGNTTTGGRLDMLAALQSVTPFKVDSITDNTAYLSWSQMGGPPSDSIRWRNLDNGNWIYEIYTGSQHIIPNLKACSTYEVQAFGICRNSLDSYSNSYTFSTLGCCKLPDEITVHGLTETSIVWFIDDVFAVNEFFVEYKKEIDGGWNSATLIKENSNLYEIDQLEECTDYLFRFQSLCADSMSKQSDTIYIKTLGCGICIDHEYCTTVTPPISSSDWIQKIKIANAIHESGNDNGYGDFTSSGPSIIMKQNKEYKITVTIGNTGTAPKELLRGWIDYNQDGEFGDDELIVSPTSLIRSQYDTSFTIPSDAILGSTRMRLMLKWPGFDGTIPGGCDEVEFGEIEDYCVMIDEMTGLDKNNANEAIKFNVYPNPFRNHMVIEGIGDLTKLDDVTIYNNGQIIYRGKDLEFETEDWAIGVYVIVVRINGEVYLRKVVRF